MHKGCGYFYFMAARKSTFYSWVMLIGGFALTFAMVFVPYDYNYDMGNAWTRGGKAFYNTFSRSIFIIGLVLALTPSLAGRFPVMNGFLGNGLFHAMAKITYSVYLIHEALFNVFNLSSREAIYVSHIEAVVLTLAIAVLAYLIGGLFTILVDHPFANIDRFFIFPSKPKAVRAGKGN